MELTSFEKVNASSFVPGKMAPKIRVKKLEVALRIVFEETLVFCRLRL